MGADSDELYRLLSVETSGKLTDAWNAISEIGDSTTRIKVRTTWDDFLVALVENRKLLSKLNNEIIRNLRREIHELEEAEKRRRISTIKPEEFGVSY